MSYWKEENERLLLTMSTHALPIRNLRTEDGYEKWWERVAAWFGERINPQFRTGFVQVFQDPTEARIYWPGDGFDLGNAAQHVTLRHECVHILQARRLGEKMGPFLFQLFYILLFPALLTARAKWEAEAYEESVLAQLEQLYRAGRYIEAPQMVARRCDVIEKMFRGRAYFWMDPLFGGEFSDWGRRRAWLMHLASGEEELLAGRKVHRRNPLLREVGWKSRI